ncbi:uncharacterized protein LOC126278730 [Schistocerca gregaria]|uniref:uncharacterized protein LOC126278730 n=1 Tax=Schistocerca gregaria TaxID=7010 RepID=UPI00211E54D6|nr:uncharacterized protein LOC126278730 [Schistocerca gregaria]
MAWRYLAPRRGRQFFRGFLPSGAVLLLVLQDAGSESDLRKLGAALLRLRGALRMLVLTPGAVLRMEPFERWTDEWGTIRQMSGPLSQALDIPAPGVLGQMRGYKLLLVHEPRDDLRVYDRLYRPAWQHSWNGRVLSLIQTQLNCSFRLIRVNKDFGTLGLYDISYSLRSLTRSAIHQFVTPAISETHFLITASPRVVIPLWTQMAVLFRQEIWLCIAAAYITACSVWYATGRSKINTSTRLYIIAGNTTLSKVHHT